MSNQDKEDMWKAFVDGEKKEYCMTAGSVELNSDGNDSATKDGIASGHAYSLLAAHEL